MTNDYTPEQLARATAWLDSMTPLEFSRQLNKVMPAPAPVAALLTALDAISWILDDWYAAHDGDGPNDDLAAIDDLYAAAAAIRGTVN